MCKQLSTHEERSTYDEMKGVPFTADKLLYHHAIELCLNAASLEFFGKANQVGNLRVTSVFWLASLKCVEPYTQAQILFHSLSQQAISESDRLILRHYREAVERRLHCLQNQGLVTVNESTATAHVASWSLSMACLETCLVTCILSRSVILPNDKERENTCQLQSNKHWWTRRRPIVKIRRTASKNQRDFHRVSSVLSFRFLSMYIDITVMSFFQVSFVLHLSFSSFVLGDIEGKHNKIFDTRSISMQFSESFICTRNQKRRWCADILV